MAADACAHVITLLRNLILGMMGAMQRTSALSLLAETAPASFVDGPRPRPSGYVADTLGLAFWSLHHAGSFDEAVTIATGIGGIAISAGAVTGMPAGARYGYSGISSR